MILFYFIWPKNKTCCNLCFIKSWFTTLSAEGSYIMEIPSSCGELSPSLLGDVSSSLRSTHSRELQAWVSVCSLLITFEFPQYSIPRLTHPLFLFSIYFMLPTLSQPPPWDSSTPLPCSDSFWEKWQLEQLQSSLIADAGQCPVPGQWHVEWTPQVPFSSLTCTPRDNYTFLSHKENQLMQLLG